MNKSKIRDALFPLLLLEGDVLNPYRIAIGLYGIAICLLCGPRFRDRPFISCGARFWPKPPEAESQACKHHRTSEGTLCLYLIAKFIEDLSSLKHLVIVFWVMWYAGLGLYRISTT